MAKFNKTAFNCWMYSVEKCERVPSLVGQSLPDQFYYPFESHHLHHLPATSTDLQQLSLTKNCETVVVEQVPLHRTRSRARSAHSKGPGGKKQKADEILHQESVFKDHETPTTEYIHVRARRGQATDSHSLAERVRRQKISEKMQILQSLVPGCDKVIGKIFKLDQIITYIQSLQNQVEYLSMKLACVRPIYNGEMCQDPTKEQETNFEKHDSPTQQPTMAATAFTEHQLENSNLLQQVQSLFSQDVSNEVLPWDVDDKTLTQNAIDSYELSNTDAPCNLY